MYFVLSFVRSRFTIISLDFIGADFDRNSCLTNSVRHVYWFDRIAGHESCVCAVDPMFLLI